MTFWNNKVVVITGGSAGLGAHLAQAFATAGSTLVLAARDGEQLERTAEEVRQSTGATVHAQVHEQGAPLGSRLREGTCHGAEVPTAAQDAVQHEAPLLGRGPCTRNACEMKVLLPLGHVLLRLPSGLFDRSDHPALVHPGWKMTARVGVVGQSTRYM